MPSPRKEYWLADTLASLGAAFAMGVGGSFDVIAGYVQRAPEWMQRAGLEWAYRFAQEPRRIWRRYLRRQSPLPGARPESVLGASRRRMTVREPRAAAADAPAAGASSSSTSSERGPTS